MIKVNINNPNVAHIVTQKGAEQSVIRLYITKGAAPSELHSEIWCGAHEAAQKANELLEIGRALC